jgi:hypothetical protein
MSRRGKVTAFWLLLSMAGSQVLYCQNPFELQTTPPHHSLSAEQPHRWILKFNPTLLVRGEAPIYLERKLGACFSAEAALGVTFEDYYKKVFQEGKTLTQKDPATEYLSGVAAKMGVRYFFHRGALTDFYISPEMDYTTYRKNVSGAFRNGGGYSEGKLMDKQAYVDYLFLIGSQSPRAMDQEIFLDWFLGAGMRTGMENNVVRTENNSAIIAQHQQSVLAPMITFGLKLGLGL